jgi:two-component system, OmpR family, response regulator CpxR
VPESHQLDGVNDAPLVLIVDDDIDIREALAEVLADAGYRVATAANGAEAWRYLQSKPRPALILLDLLMPVMTGPELLTELRSSEQLGSIPTILMTASPQWNTNAELKLLTKPMRTELLLDTIKQVACPPGAGR